MEQIPYSTSATGEIPHRDHPRNNPGHPDIFIKLYTAALDSGFLATLPDREWKTLCVMALHMDATGQCYPSRDAMARALGVNPSTASARIQRLLAFRWQGQPLVQATRERHPDGTLGRQVYTILPLVPLGFGPQEPPTPPPSGPSPATSDNAPEGDVSPSPLSGSANRGERTGDHDPSDMSDSPPTRNPSGTKPLGRALPAQGKGGTNTEKPNVVQPNMVTSNGATANVEDPDLNKQDPGQTRSRINKIPDKLEPPGEKKTHEQPGAVRQEPLPQKDGGPKAHHRSPEDPEGKKNPRRHSPAAQALTRRLKTQLQARGVTVFPRDWSLKGQASAEALLHHLSVDEVETLMDWALAHPFWGTKIGSMHQLTTIAPQWQQHRNRAGIPPQPGDRGKPSSGQSPTVAERNTALLQRLHAQMTRPGEGGAAR